MRLLCLADIHLGRQPARLPDAVRERVGTRALGPAGAWARAVDYALACGVDAVLIAGDVVEQHDDFHEAFVDLRSGVERLTRAGIRVLGVTGNHDVSVLPRLAETIAAFELLGVGGTWEAADLDAGDARGVRVVGWSFPEARVRTSPLASALPARGPRATIGLLHCDRDQPRSPYAPVRSSELQAAPVDAWLLGHIHRPDDLGGGEGPSGYLGSLTGLDPGEDGEHGAWLVSIDAAGRVGAEQVPLAPLRWAELDVAVGDLSAAEDVHQRIVARLDELHAMIAEQTQRPLAVGCRLRLTGHTALRRAIERTLTGDDPTATPGERDGIVYFVHDWRLDLLPAIDLEAAAESRDPAGRLAHKLLVLRGGDSVERRELIQAARERMEAVVRRQPYNALGVDAPDDEEVAATLEAAARRALDDLLAQREAGV